MIFQHKLLMRFCILTDKQQHTPVASVWAFEILYPLPGNYFQNPLLKYFIVKLKGEKWTISKSKMFLMETYEQALNWHISNVDSLWYKKCVKNKITVIIISFIGFSWNYNSNKDGCWKESILAQCFMLTLPDISASATLETDIITCSALSNWKFHLIKMQLLWKHHSSVIFACRRYRKKNLSINIQVNACHFKIPSWFSDAFIYQ